VKQPDRDEDPQRHQLSDRQEVHQKRALPNSTHIDPGQGQDQRGDQKQPGRTAVEAVPIESHRQGETIHDRRLACDPGEPLHPADLEAGESAECGSRVERGTARRFEAAADLRKAERDQQGGHPREDESHHTPITKLRRNRRRHQKDRAANHLINADGRQVPATERAPQ
jgi:hypothetical protein